MGIQKKRPVTDEFSRIVVREVVIYINLRDFCCAPRGRVSPVEGGSTQRVVDCSGSWRAVWLGDQPDRSLATKAALGGWAIRRAVTWVKPEQASKVEVRMPTRLQNGEGRVSGEAIDKRTRLDPPG